MKIFFLYGHDTLEYSIRLKNNNFNLGYIPEAIMWHKSGISAWKLSPFKRVKFEVQGIYYLLKSLKWYYLPTASIFTLFSFLQLKIKASYIFLTNKQKRMKLLNTIKK